MAIDWSGLEPPKKSGIDWSGLPPLAAPAPVTGPASPPPTGPQSVGGGTGELLDRDFRAGARKPPPSVPIPGGGQAMPEQQPRAGGLSSIAGGAVEGLKEGFGDEPIKPPNYFRPLDTFMSIVELANRSANAVIGAGAGAVGESAQNLGMSQGMAQRGKRTVMEGAQALGADSMMPLFGHGGPGSFTKPVEGGIPDTRAPLPNEPKAPPPSESLTRRTFLAGSRTAPVDEFKAIVDSPRKAPPDMSRRALFGGMPKAPPPDQKITEQSPDKGFVRVEPPAAKSLGAAATPQGQMPQLPLHERPMDYESQQMPANAKAEARTEAQRRAEMNPVRKLGTYLHDIWAPQSADATARRAEAAIRETQGRQERDTEMARAGFEQYQRQVNAMSEADRWKMVDYIENRSKPGVKPFDKRIMPVVDEIRDQYQKAQAKLEDVEKLQGTKYSQPMHFIDDYLKHMFKETPKSRFFFETHKTGHTIPTYKDAIKAGLTPVTSNPLEMTMSYIDAANRFVANAKMYEIGRKTGDIKWYKYKQAPDGWEPLKMPPNHLGQTAHAPQGWARIFNNNRGSGWHGTEASGAIFDALRATANASTQAKLSFSGFHILTETHEAIVSAMANAAGQLVRGHPLQAAKAAIRAPFKPLAPLKDFIPEKAFGMRKPEWLMSRGRKLQRQYQGLSDFGPDYDKMTDLMTRSNFRTVSYDKSLKASYGSLVQAFKRGSLKLEMRDAMRQIKGPLSAATQLWKGVARVMDTVSAPIFEHFVPLLKVAAFDDRMSTFLREHPLATDQQQLAFARRLSDSIDNRMGLMVQDNIFWTQGLKQSLQVALTSYSWTGGTIREIAGMPADVFRHGRESLKGEYIIGLVVTYAMLNTVYQTLKTGKPPEDLNDILAPRTGGDQPANQYRPNIPERAVLPSYMKDILGWWNDPTGEPYNKLNAFMKAGHDLWTQHDWRGDPLGNPDDSWLWASAKTIIESFTPISFQTADRTKPGTNIGTGERFMGIRPAPMYLNDPVGYQGMKRAKAATEMEKKLNYQANQAQAKGDMATFADLKRQIRLMKAQEDIAKAKDRASYSHPKKPTP